MPENKKKGLHDGKESCEKSFKKTDEKRLLSFFSWPGLCLHADSATQRSPIMKDEIKKQVEIFLETQLSGGNFEVLMARLSEELKKAIPGKIDDVVLDAILPKLLPIVKDHLLKQVEKISDKV